VDELGERPARPAGRDMAWWGWGSPDHPRELPPHALAFLSAELGPLRPTPRLPPRLEDVELPAPAPVPHVAVEIDTGRAGRVTHAAGRSYPDLIRLRSGRLERAPDGVARPRDRAEVGELVRRCAAAGVAVVPWGGGTSVVGGLDPLRGDHAAVLALDLGRLDRLVALDARSELAVLGAGLRGPEVEQLLGGRGLTLGHFPQSWEYATAGGWVATRSAGQASTGYGRIEELLVGLRAATPAGEVELAPRPASAAGPDLRELLAGSEGVLGVITEVALRVRPKPARARYEGWSFASFADGVEAFRELEQRGEAADVARLSDPEETRLTFALAGRGAPVLALRAYRRARGHGAGCLAILGWEGAGRDVARRRDRAAARVRRLGGVTLGPAPGRAWAHGRYAAPYLRDTLIGHGVLAETLETATTWSRLEGLHRAVGTTLRGALAARSTPPLVLCHVSHLYPTGASLYFTVLARQEEGAELEQWRAAKRAAGDAIVAAGGTITHHHAVGTDHAPWMGAEVGEAGLAVLRAAKRAWDPAGVLNPGKLLPDAGR
jgi:alkyldihydroxyacetonephosphate synthase